MKILRVINSLNIGGAERSVLGNVPVHIQNGFDVEVLLLNGTKTYFYKELSEKKVEIICLGENNNIYNPLLIFKICKLIKNYDVLHVSLFPALYWVAFAKFFTRAKTKLIFTEHNTHNKRMGNLFFKVLEKFIYNQYDRIIAISPETEKNLKDHLGNKIPVKTIYNGVDVDKIFLESIEISSFDILTKSYKNKIIILQVAAFRNQKDQDTLIRSLSLLNENVHLLFAGDGPRLKICKDLAQKLNVLDQITFLGIQSNINALYGISDIVVMSSHYEGFGRAAVEGMAAKNPVIASDVDGLSEIVRNYGILFEAGNHIDLSEKINKLIEDKNYSQFVAESCFNRAKDFDIKKMISEYEEIYTTV
ncbi:glycosyltransferase [Halpernia frigidisoli]|uniref:Glycosyltransferase involved in cell wall bisynthesis n=1 Tax=Halpernia frigidisoli TaxID=1125876 RepID=A0A1I3FE02_9FLAO|nr:glycosyltransferase [Halpernia frigidisoli]SFI09449.1 Glycosyltransferase involved in cell wall bisynthesis [Halpernia frigidisoli]